MDPDASRRLIARVLGAASRRAVSDAMTERIAADLPDLRADDAIFGSLAASVEANVENVTHAIVLDVPVQRIEVPLAALEYPRRVAQRGMAATSLVRAYYLGQQTMIALIGEALDADPEPGQELREAAMRWLVGWSFDYNDVVTRRVLDEYETERAAWVDARSGARTVRVLEVLDGEVPSVAAASASIRYPLRASHIGMVVWYSEGVDEVERIERFLRELGAAAGAVAPPLTMAVDRLTAWAWLPVAGGETAIAAAREFVAADPDAPRVVFGPPREGLEGFRATNRAAREVQRVAERRTRRCSSRPTRAWASRPSSPTTSAPPGRGPTVCSGPWAGTPPPTSGCAAPWRSSCAPAAASRRRPSSSSCTRTR